MKILAIVPARDGSKGLKNKNMSKFLGKPLIYYSLNLMKKLKGIHPFISTDSKEIKRYCAEFGFNDKYLRPKNLASDTANVVDVTIDAINYLEKKNHNFKYVLLLQPTSPLRNLKQIAKWINFIKKNNISSSASAYKISYHPSEILKFKKKNWKFLIKNKRDVFRRQDFDKNFFFIDGSFYMCKVKTLKKNRSFLIENKTHIFKVNSEYPIDINNSLDLKIAEIIYRNENRK